MWIRRTASLYTGLIVLTLVSGHLSAQEQPCDRKATKETISLYNSLKKLMSKGFMMGHRNNFV